MKENNEYLEKLKNAIDKAWEAYNINRGKELEEHFSRILFNLFEKYKEMTGKSHPFDSTGHSLNESITEIVKQELLNEATYKQFKNEVKFRTKAEMLHKAMREVKRKLGEIDRLVEYTNRMKQELNEGGGITYWGRTEKAIGQISETLNHLVNKVKNLRQ